MENRNTTQQRSPTAGLMDFLIIVFKHKYKILLIFLVTAAVAIIAIRRIPAIYEAESTLLVKFGREYIYRPEVGDGGPVSTFSPEGAISAEIKILTSRDVLEKVVTGLGIENIYPDLMKKPSSQIAPLGVAVYMFEKGLNVQAIPRSNLIEVQFQHGNPQIAAKAVNTLVGLFRDKHLQVYSDSQSSFVETQARVYEGKLKESENRLETFKQNRKAYSLDERRTLLLKQSADLDASLKGSQNRIDGLQNRLSSLKAQLKKIPETKERYSAGTRQEIEKNDALAQAKSQLLALQLKERELLEKYKEDSRTVTSVRKEIEIVRDFLRQQQQEDKVDRGSSKMQPGKTETIENPVYQEVEKEIVKTEADLSAESAKVPILQRQFSEINGEIQNLEYREKDLQNLRREVLGNEKNYRTYLDKLEETRIGEDMDRQKMANIVVIEEAAVPALPIKDNTKAKKIRLLGILLGVVLGLGSAYASEYMGQGMSTPEAAEKRLGIPVLASFPYKKAK